MLANLKQKVTFEACHIKQLNIFSPGSSSYCVPRAMPHFPSLVPNHPVNLPDKLSGNFRIVPIFVNKAVSLVNQRSSSPLH